MKFSKIFLNKLLNSAIYFHNSKINGEEIPSKFNNVEDIINKFSNAIEFEAKKALQNEILIEKPFLHAVNLKTKEPGIISHKENKAD